MTQGAPVLAGMTNTASQTTTINMEGSFVGLSVVAASPHVGAPTQSGPRFKRAGSIRGPRLFTPSAEDAVSTRWGSMARACGRTAGAAMP